MPLSSLRMRRWIFFKGHQAAAALVAPNEASNYEMLDQFISTRSGRTTEGAGASSGQSSSS